MAVTAITWQKAVSEASTMDEGAARAEEENWIARSRRGDLEAFGLIYRRYEAGVFRYACRLLENPDEADDIRQETFVRAYQSLARFRGDSRIKTYLFAICGNLCRDRLRHHLRHPAKGYGLAIPEGASWLTDAASSSEQDPLTGLERAASAALLRRALQRLAPADRELLLLYHVEEIGLDEIALVIGCSRSGVPVRLFRARRRLRDAYLLLQKEEGE